MNKLAKFAVVSTFSLIVFSAATCRADFTFTGFELTENSLEFSMSGTLPDELPNDFATSLFFINSDINASPGFALGSYIPAQTATYSGSQDLDSVFPVGTGGEAFGDYFVINFQDALTPGEVFSGEFSATWGPNRIAFDPDAFEFLNVQWGTGDALGEGLQLGTISSVPEPSAVSLLLLGAIGLLQVKTSRQPLNKK